MFMKHYAPTEPSIEGGQGGCERRIEVVVEIKKKIVKIQKKIFWGEWGGGRVGGGRFRGSG